MITSSIQIAKDPQTVWRALTNKELMREWYFDIADFELREGHEFHFYEPGGGRKYFHQCRIREIQPQKKLVHTWTHPTRSKGESVVTWELQENENGTLVTLSHDGLEHLADAGPEFVPGNFQAGWDGFLQRLKNYVNGLRTKTYEVFIQAKPQTVWNALFEPSHFKEWTSVFSEGSHYTGNMGAGERIHFLNEQSMGMYADVRLYDPPRQMIFQHLGTVQDGQEISPDADKDLWAGAFESYTLSEQNGGTRLVAQVDTGAEYAAYFDETFPKGLQKVKQLSE